jgi:predicted ATPase
MHYFKNFKNFADAKINLLQPVTLLIGRNGSGKSNVIEGVELLAQLAHGRPLFEISDVGRGSGTTFEVRGGLIGCAKVNHNDLNAPLSQLSSTFTFEFGASFQKRPFKYSITTSANSRVGITAESLKWSDGTLIFETVTVKEAVLGISSVRYNNFARGGIKPIVKLSSDRSSLSRYEEFASHPKTKEAKDALKLVRAIEQHLNASFVFDPNPKLMRGYENIGQTTLNKDGSNLSSVLHSLTLDRPTKNLTEKLIGNEVNKIQGEQTIARIQKNISALPEDAFTELEFEETKFGEVGLAFKYSENSSVSARLMSDGTLRALAILTALETVPHGSRIVVEEFDNGIHPSRVKILIDAIWECSTRRELNVLATTHNPATLDHLNDAQVASVVLCYYDHETKTSALTPIHDLPMAESMLERGRLGDLLTRQILEKHVQPNFEDQHKEKGLAWLERFKAENPSSPSAG